MQASAFSAEAFGEPAAPKIELITVTEVLLGAIIVQIASGGLPKARDSIDLFAWISQTVRDRLC